MPWWVWAVLGWVVLSVAGAWLLGAVAAAAKREERKWRARLDEIADPRTSGSGAARSPLHAAPPADVQAARRSGLAAAKPEIGRLTVVRGGATQLRRRSLGRHGGHESDHRSAGSPLSQPALPLSTP